jgi:hypothetical protein
MGRLKEGETVTTPAGLVRPSDCLTPSPPPFRVALVQDCSDCTEAYPSLQGVDVLVHESTFQGSLGLKAAEFGHSTSAQAGRVARHVGAKALILTHFSTRYGAGQRNRIEISSRQSPTTAATREVGPEEKGEEEGEADASTEKAGPVTTDQLVLEAAKAYMDMEGQTGPPRECIPIWAAEDYLVFHRTLPDGLRLSDFAAEVRITTRRQTKMNTYAK